jgi:hypothetical protein
MSLESIALKSAKVTQDFIDAWYTFKKIDPLKDKTDYSAIINRDFSTLKKGQSVDTTNDVKPNDSPTGKKALDAIQSLVSSQEKASFAELDSDIMTTKGILDNLRAEDGGIGGIGTILGNIINNAKDGFIVYESQQSALLNELNKNIGMTGKLSADYREELTKTNVQLLKYGITFQDLSKAAQSLVTNTGRFLMLNEESFKKLALAGQAYVGTLQGLVEMLPAFEKVGIGAIGASKAIVEAGQGALELGLNSQKVTKDIGTNVERLNEFGFQNGIQGLAKMVEKTIEFRSSMDSVYKLADKVMNPEGALDLAANLQVLGGAIGEMGDPLKMTYMATNNMEGLQDAILETAGSLASYNAQAGKFEINAVNMRRGKDMAQAMGIEYKELAQTAIAFQERGMAKTQLLNLGISEDQKDFITNLSHMEGGELKIDLQGTTFKKDFKDIVDENGAVTLQQVADNSKLRQAIIDNQDDLKKKTPEDIIKGQATNVQNIMRNVSFMAAAMRMTGGKAVEDLASKVGLDMSAVADGVEKKLKSGELKVEQMGEYLTNLMKEEGKGTKEELRKLVPKSITSNTSDKDLKGNMVKENAAAAMNNSNKTIEHKITFGGGPSEMTALRRELTKNQNLFSDFLDVEKKGEYTEN